MTLRADPGFELLTWIVNVLRADETLNALLYANEPALNEADKRVYQQDVELPDGPVRTMLPRVLVEVSEDPFEVEQDIDVFYPQARADVTLHVIVEPHDRRLGEHISARTREVLGSTPVFDSSIIGGALVVSRTLPPVRETAFRNAWRFTRQYRVSHLGVL